MNRVDRLLGMLTHLQSKKYVPAEKLAEKFNISVRTVYRDIKALTELGIPVSFEQYKGYFIVAGYFLPPVAFSADEANALLLMGKLVAGFGDRSIEKHYSNALLKIKTVLRSTQKDVMETLDEHIVFQFPEKYTPNFEYLTVIQNAIAEKKVLKMVYKNQKEETSTREIEPIGLVFYAFFWHVIAWCSLRGEYRDFKVSRIQQLHMTLSPFSGNGRLSIQEYMQQLPVNY